MSVERLTISMESELAESVREAADADSTNVSAWLTQAARRQLAARGLAGVLADWEAENGAFTEAELNFARQQLSR